MKFKKKKTTSKSRMTTKTYSRSRVGCEMTRIVFFTFVIIGCSSGEDILIIIKSFISGQGPQDNSDSYK